MNERKLRAGTLRALRAVLEALAEGLPIRAAMARCLLALFPEKRRDDLEPLVEEMIRDAKIQPKLVSSQGGPVPWAWGAVLPEGQFSDGFNLTSFTDAGLGKFAFTFATDLPDGNYAIVVSPERGQHRITAKSPGAFQVEFEEGGQPIEPAFSFVVYARPLQARRAGV